MSTDKIPSGEIIRRWHRALRHHPDLAADLRQCAALAAEMRADTTQKREQAELLWGTVCSPLAFEEAHSVAMRLPHNEAIRFLIESSPDSSPGTIASFVCLVDSYVGTLAHLPHHCRQWLLMRYARIWKEAPPLTSYGLRRGLELAAGRGAWGAALEPLLDSIEPTPVRASIFRNARNLVPPWRDRDTLIALGGDVGAYMGASPLHEGDWSELADAYGGHVHDHVAVVLHLFDGTDKATAVKRLEDLWDEHHIDSLVKPPAGYHGVGDVEDLHNKVTLYRLYKQFEANNKRHNHRVSYKSFALQASAGDLPVFQRAKRLYGKRQPQRLTWMLGQSVNVLKTTVSDCVHRFQPDTRVPSLREHIA